MTIKLAENRYGKSRIRLVRVNRQAPVHDFQEWTVEVLLQGDFLSCFADGDNSKILPTDTMKNTVYSVARSFPAACMEEFATELLEYFWSRNPQITEAEVLIREKSWQHLNTGGKPHPTAFVQCGSELQTAHAGRNCAGDFLVKSGIADLVLMRTADSSFEGYIHDSLTTLPESSDRLLGTSLSASWFYSSLEISYAPIRGTIRESLLTTFANHKSKSVQHTLYAMAESAIAAAPQISEITLTMPNKHCLLVDLSRFGQDNPNHIFVPTDEPHGYIEARICRGS